jgi:hypothetical protein
VDAPLGHVSERDELVVGRQPQLQALRPQPQAEERRQVYRRTVT